MMPIPFDEVQRLGSLHALDILDTPPEPAFDRITRLASKQFDVPIALISLIDPARQWFKSKVGLSLDETPRADSFCQFAIMEGRVMQVLDASRDPRFADNVLVTGDPRIRYYAGAPLTTGKGFRLGTLCLIDTKARRALSQDQEAQLRDLADLVIHEMELRRLRKLLGTETATVGSELAGALRSLREADDALSQQAQMDVMAHMAQEFRTPLNAMLSFAEIISKEFFGKIGDPRYANFAAQIEDCGNHLIEVLGRTLDLAQAAQGGLTLVDSVIDLKEIASLVEKLCWSELNKYQARLVLDLETPTPKLLADRNQLSQMLVNLICNAARYVETDSVITLQARRRPDGGLDLSVIDQGCGMNSEAIRKAIAPFGKATSADLSDHTGLGIGLPLTKRLVEMHGGSLAIDSRPGQGTKMSLRFPAYRVNETGAGEADARP